MTEPTGAAATAAPPASQDPPAADDDGGGRGGMTWLDGLGIAAGVMLAVIVVDILSDGRLISRRLLRRGEPQAPQAPQEPADEPAGA